MNLESRENFHTWWEGWETLPIPPTTAKVYEKEIPYQSHSFSAPQPLMSMRRIHRQEDITSLLNEDDLILRTILERLGSREYLSGPSHALRSWGGRRLPPVAPAHHAMQAGLSVDFIENLSKRLTALVIKECYKNAKDKWGYGQYISLLHYTSAISFVASTFSGIASTFSGIAEEWWSMISHRPSIWKRRENGLAIRIQLNEDADGSSPSCR